MIVVIGNGQSPESSAANLLGDLACRAWPWLKDDPTSFLTIIPGVQCHGQTPRDIDIVVLGYFKKDADSFLSPSGPLTLHKGIIVEPSRVKVNSICLTIEVKDHTPGGVKFYGTNVNVLYPTGWHDATDQSQKQLHSLRNYLIARRSAVIPRVTNLIWLRNIPPHELPSPPHNILHCNLTWTGLLDQAASTSQILQIGNDSFIYSALNREGYETGPSVFATALDALATKIIPTELDRKKMDNMFNSPNTESWFSYIGKKQITFRGHGGTGKTMLLLQIANAACKDGKRVLLLTYNNALVADLLRLMTLANISDDLSAGAIQVKTVQSFFHSVLFAYGLIRLHEDDFLDNYLGHLSVLFKALTDDTRKDLNSSTSSSLPNWDLILIDEGQDWPSFERDILRGLYTPRRLIIADGIQQFVRHQEACNWTCGLEDKNYLNVSLTQGLRLKRNLAAFSNRMAQCFDLTGWSVDENTDAIGGRVIIVEGNYFTKPETHHALIKNARELGNCPVDLLACVPPILATGNHMEADKRDNAAIAFQEIGQTVWDGTDVHTRKTYPTSLEQIRLVQYDSCRGLEGWVTINLGFDLFYQWKHDSCRDENDIRPGVYSDDIIVSRRYAARWMMIALTRAIDTLVIEVSKKKSPLKTHLKSLYDGPCRDFIEWIT